MSDPNVTITIPLSRLNLVLSALGELPAKLSLDAILDLQQQAQKALQPKAPVEVPLSASDPLGKATSGAYWGL